MYIPTWFKEERLQVLQKAINEISFGTLITNGKTGLMASHVPMLLDKSRGKFGILFGHVARGNSQWRDTFPHSEALATFVGPNAYITPNWYQTKRETGKVVPTWNYINVQVRGEIKFFDSHDDLLKIVTNLTNYHEAYSQKPWKVTDAPPEYIDDELQSIIGFEITATAIEGKWKLSQNRSKEDRNGVIKGLKERGRRMDETLAEEMEDRFSS